jgi:Fe-S-cluster-containing dehydrogenase component/CRP-like cAMP-binding protein
MSREITNRDAIIDAIRSVDSIDELIEQTNGEFTYELDLDVIVFGRNYHGKQVGPYARLAVYDPGEVIIDQGSWSANTFYILIHGELKVTIVESDEVHEVGRIVPGQSFGEMAVLSGARRVATVTVASETPALVLVLDRPALRLLRKLPKFGAALDKTYRSYGMSLSLREIDRYAPDLFNDETLRRFADATRLVVYEKNHVLFQEGDPINRFVFVKHGWIRRVSGAEYNPARAELMLAPGGDLGVDFLGSGNCLGFEGFESPSNWQYSATVMARTEVIEVAMSRLRADPELRSAITGALTGISLADDQPRPNPPVDQRAVTAAATEIDTGIVDGENLLVMDMDLCIRCGNCSMACHQVHGHSRLVRRGIQIQRPVRPTRAKLQNLLAPSVCLHCHDAECLTGCPTGAIARFPGGEIEINNATCIGCGDCATQCPYDAIAMIPRDGADPARGFSLSGLARSTFSLARNPLPDPVTAMEDLLAIKCNLCNNTKLNPPGAKTQVYSCQENCPTGALLRVNPREYFSEITGSIGLIHQDQTRPIGRNFHRGDPWILLLHLAGILLCVGIGGAAVWATRHFTSDGVVGFGWLTMRWLTGLTGLAGIVWVMLYPMRKKVYRRRAGPLRYWLLSHVYLGVLAGLVILVHSGTRSGGLLTSLLTLSFDLVIFTGIFGAACYLIVPRMLTAIEGEPLLIEDLIARRRELREQLVTITEQVGTSGGAERTMRLMRRRFLSFGFLLRQFLRREGLASMLAQARGQFTREMEKMEGSDRTGTDGALLLEAVETMVTVRRVDAIISLHRLLKLWVAPHVVFTALMLALMAVHIAQAIYFRGS